MTFRLKCDKCGRVTETAARQRRCKHVEEIPQAMGAPRRVYCWGRLIRNDRKRRDLTDLDKAAHAERQLAIATTRMKRAVTSMELWARRRKYYLDKAEGRIRQSVRPAKPKIDRHSRTIELSDD